MRLRGVSQTKNGHLNKETHGETHCLQFHRESFILDVFPLLKLGHLPGSEVAC